jgi:hypothetical protein
MTDPRSPPSTGTIRRGPGRIDATADAARGKLNDCFADLLAHAGHGELRVEARWDRAGVREILIHYGRQFRYLIREAEA